MYKSYAFIIDFCVLAATKIVCNMCHVCITFVIVLWLFFFFNYYEKIFIVTIQKIVIFTPLFRSQG